MNNLFLYLVIILPLITRAQIDDQHCKLFLDKNSPYIQNTCQNQTKCTIEDGLNQLINNSSNSSKLNTSFQLCLNLSDFELTIQTFSANATQIDQSLYINALSVTMNNYSLQSYQNIIIETESSIVFNNVTINGFNLWFSSKKIQIINSHFSNQSTIETQCTCLSQKKCNNWTFQYPHFYNPNFNINLSQSFNFTTVSNYKFNSLTIIGFQSIKITGMNSKYSIMGIFSKSANIDNSTISATGLGYPSDSGPGCGYFNQILNQLIGCVGSGGSYGGFGGSSSPQNCYLMISKSPYGNITYPKDPGSGGGGFLLPQSHQSSSGGGIINIQVENLIMDSVSINTDGRNGSQGGGGGSGGSISIDYSWLSVSKNNSIISANGGGGDKISSSGSGGRIRFWNHNWNISTGNDTENLTHLTITANGRTTCQQGKINCGQSGSIFPSPCPLGQQLIEPHFFCQSCIESQYQLSFGYSVCLPCPPLPANAQWQENESFSCNYKCSDSSFSIFNGKCISNTQKFFEQHQIIDIFISIGMIIFALIIFGIMKIVQYTLKHKREFISHNNDSQKEQKKIFRIQDLPYHQYRIYLMGQNSPDQPWQITKQASSNFDEEVKEQYTMVKIRTKIRFLISSINSKAKYSKKQKILLKLLNLYPPCKMLISNLMKKKKIKAIQEQFNEFNGEDNRQQQLNIKFHVKPHRTVASIQIFDYNKKQEDFDIQKCYPLYFMLQKTPFGGYTLDLSDPFLRLLLSEISQREGYINEIQNFLKEINVKLQKKQQIISCLNHLQKVNQLSPKLQAFLWQPPNKILGLKLDYQINHNLPLFLVINSQNLNNTHFFYQNRLNQIYFNQVEGLKKIIQIKEHLSNEDHGSNFWIIENEINERVLIWILGIFTGILILLSISTIIFMLLTRFIYDQNAHCFNAGKPYYFLIGFLTTYFVLAPFCDFAVCFFNFKTILQKNQFLLYTAMLFNICTGIKSFLLFFQSLPLQFGTYHQCFRINMFIWLTMGIISIIIYVVQIMLRARIIVNTK